VFLRYVHSLSLHESLIINNSLQQNNIRPRTSPMVRLAPSTIPPDVLEVRRKRISEEMCAAFRTRHDPRTDSPPSLLGMGTYTHVRPHLRLHGSLEFDFLPLGGPDRIKRDERGTIVDKQESVKQAYAKLKGVMEEEEKLDWEAFSPRTRFHALNSPDDASPTGEERNRDMGVGTRDERTSIGSIQEVIMGGMTAAGTATAAPTSTYDASRDPRRRK
jgi:hypothetical protein